MMDLQPAFVQEISLNGTWQIEIGGQRGHVQVPGAWEVQGYSLTEEFAIYRRSVEIPDTWQNQRITIRFSAVSYHIKIFANSVKIGSHTGLWTAFEFDITDSLRIGEANHFEFHITKSTEDEAASYPYRNVIVGFIPYISQTFGGPWQDIVLLAHASHKWKTLNIQPDWQTGIIDIHSQLTGVVEQAKVRMSISDLNGRPIVELMRDLTGESFEYSFQIADHHLWSPDEPYLYSLSLQLIVDEKVIDCERRQFGFRSLAAFGDQLRMNGQSCHLRGILHWGWYPQKLAPTPSDEEIRREFRQLRELGFNLIKLCLFVPPSNFFDIADEEGMLLWLELPLWWQLINPHLNQQAPLEYADILNENHHHPSIVLYSLGCELGSEMASQDLIEQLDLIVRERSIGTLVCDNSGSGEAYGGFTDKLTDFYDYHFYSDLHYFKPLVDHFHRDWRPARPWIFGEFCAYDDYRDPTLLVNETGQRPWWRDLLGFSGGIHRWAYREQESRIESLNLPFDHAAMTAISHRQSLAIRRYILEQTRLRQFISGYVITGLRDTPINSSGIFDDSLNFKFEKKRFSQINSASFIGLETGRARIWKDGDQPYPLDRFNHASGKHASFHIIYSGNAASRGSLLSWNLEDPAGKHYAQGTAPLSAQHRSYQPDIVTTISWDFPLVDDPQQWCLKASIEGTAANEWPLWIYPPAIPFADNIYLYDPAGALPGFHSLQRHIPHQSFNGILISSVWTENLAEWVRAGGRCIVLQAAEGGLPTRPVGFWQEALHLLYDHPILLHFPHEGHVDLQFYHLACMHAIDTSRLTKTIDDLHIIVPIIRRLHTRLFTISDYLAELQIGTGIALVSTLRFEGGLGDQVNGMAANIAGRYLLDEMLNYLNKLP